MQEWQSEQPLHQLQLQSPPSSCGHGPRSLNFFLWLLSSCLLCCFSDLSLYFCPYFPCSLPDFSGYLWVIAVVVVVAVVAARRVHNMISVLGKGSPPLPSLSLALSLALSGQAIKAPTDKKFFFCAGSRLALQVKYRRLVVAYYTLVIDFLSAVNCLTQTARHVVVVVAVDAPKHYANIPRTIINFESCSLSLSVLQPIPAGRWPTSRSSAILP